MPRRVLLAFVIFLCLGLSMPALAEPGQGGGQGNGQDNGPPTTPTTEVATPQTTVTAQGNGQGNRNKGQPGNGQNNATTRPSLTLPTGVSAAAGVTSASDPGTVVTDRIAFFLAPVSQEADPSSPFGVGTAQSTPERMISWLLSLDQQRFIPVISSPLAALIVVGRALASAGSGAVAPIALLAAIAVTKLFDRRRARAKPSIRAL